MAHITGILSSLLFFVTGIFCQNAPVFTTVQEGSMLVFQVREDLKVGDLAFRVTADDPDGDQLRFSIISSKFQMRDPFTGEVELAQKLDFETEPTINAVVSASDRNTRTTQDALIEVIDVNDEMPRFSEDYQARISERTVSGTAVIGDIRVTDSDQIGDTIEVYCLPAEPSIDNDPCDYFRIVEREASKSEWRGELVTKRGIDFEITPRFQVPVYVSDGKNSMIQNFEVAIDNEQDTAPLFIGFLTFTIEQTLAAGEVVATVAARDGDATPGEVPRAIRYEIESGSDRYNLFEIDSVTGTIRLRQDINSVNLPRNFVTINVVAREVLPGNQLGSTLGLTATQAQIIINIRDSSKLPPAFEPQIFNAYVVENCNGTQSIATINLVQRDQSTVSEYAISLETHADLFTVSPRTVSGSRPVTLNITDNCKLDYDQGLRNYKVIILATDTVSRLEGRGTVDVTLQDGNDNAPRFSQSNYPARIPEDFPGGQVFTTVSATDLDSGPNGEVCYKLDPPSKYFGIVYNTGQIYVKDCATPGFGDCLDYERQQDYKLNVVARDKCGEGLFSNATVSITVTNRNDNPPRVDQDYVTSILEGERDPNVQVTAIDPDGTTDIRYVLHYLG